MGDAWVVGVEGPVGDVAHGGALEGAAEDLVSDRAGFEDPALSMAMNRICAAAYERPMLPRWRRHASAVKAAPSSLAYGYGKVSDQKPS